jgi:uncharacterized protein YjiS (DUF1127 family)
MSMMVRAAAEPGHAGSFGGVLRWLAGWANRLITYFHRRAAIKMLMELDDRALRDIGLTRSHIEAAVKGEFRGRGG